jgi:O-antigen ligase
MDVDVAGNASNAALMGREEQAESLTGRLPIWEALSPYIHQGYLLGYGYDSFWVPSRVSQISSELHWGIREAHSAYLDTILSVGLVGGSVLLLAIFVSLYKTATLYLRTNDSSYGFLFGLYVFGLINAFTESGMMMPMFVPFIGLAGMAHLAYFDRESPSTREVWPSHLVPAPALS